jgi:hypothetical protein
LEIRKDRKDELIDMAENIASCMWEEMLRKNRKSGGSNELKRVLNYSLRKSNLKELLKSPPPRSSGGMKDIWGIMKDIITPYIDNNRYSKDEFNYILGWATRILRYKESKAKTEERKPNGKPKQKKK